MVLRCTSIILPHRTPQRSVAWSGDTNHQIPLIRNVHLDEAYGVQTSRSSIISVSKASAGDRDCGGRNSQFRPLFVSLTLERRGKERRRDGR